MLHTTVQLSAATFEVVWSTLRLGDLPNPLFIPPAGATVAARQDVLRDAVAELRSRDLLTRDNDLRDDVTAALRLLRQPTDEFYGWLVRPDDTALSALVAVGDDRAVLAILDNDLVRLCGTAPGTPAQTVVGLAPRLSPAPGTSISVPATEFALPAAPPAGRFTRPAGSGEFGPVLQANIPSGRQSDGARLRELVARPSIGRGQLFAATRNRTGRRVAAAAPLYYLDTDDGRWMLHLTRQQGGEQWITAAPGTPEGLTRALYDTHRELLRGTN